MRRRWGLRRGLVAVGLAAVAPSMAGGQFQAGSAPQSLAVADFDGDGLADFVVANAFDDTVTVHLGSGGFAVSQAVPVGLDDAVLGDSPRSVQLVDLDRDGRPEVVVLCSGNFALGVEPSISVLRWRDGVGLGRWTTRPLFDPPPVGDDFPVRMATGDFGSGAGRDLVVASRRGQALRVLVPDASGSYRLELSIPLPGEVGPVLVEDIDGDGLDDLVAAAGSGVWLVRQSSPGVFDPPAQAVGFGLGAGVEWRGLAFADWTADGFGDLLGVAPDIARLGTRLGVDGQTAGSESPGWLATGLPAGIRAILWDADTVADAVLLDRGEGSIRLWTGGGGDVAISTGAGPRSMRLADLDGDGLLDILVASDGDISDPGNVDVTAVLNARGAGGGGFEARDDSILPIGGKVGPRLGSIVGADAGQAGNIWILHAGGEELQEVARNPNLNASPTARFGQAQSWPEAVGGIAFTGLRDAFVVERDSARITAYNTQSGPGASVTFGATAGPLGWRGLAVDPGTGDFLVSDPGLGRILRVSPGGEVLEQVVPGEVVWSLRYDAERGLVWGGSPLSSELVGFDPASGWAVVARHDLAGIFEPAGGTGVAGIATAPNRSHLDIVFTNGLLASYTPGGGSLSQATTVSPALAPVSVAGSTGGELALLGSDYHMVYDDSPDLGSAVILSLVPAVESSASFRPVAVAFDESANRILVLDGDAARAAVIRKTGQFDGFRTFAAPVPGVRGFCIDETGTTWFRTRFALVEESGGTRFPLPEGRDGSISVRNGIAWAGTTNPGEFARLDLGDGSAELVAVAGAAAGIVATSQGDLVAVGPDGVLRTVTVSGVGETAGTAGTWIHYE